MSDLQNTVLDKQRKFATDRVLADVGSFFDGLVTEYKKEHNRLPEIIFKNTFLPYFSGEKPIEEGSSILADWFSVAGSHTAEVTIIDNQTGEPLFDVPAVGSRSRINYAYNKERNMTSIDDIAATTEALGKTMVERGLKFQSDAHESRVKTLLDKNNPVAQKVLTELEMDVQRWNAIFERYGIKTAASEQSKEVVVNKARQELDDDMSF